MELWQKNAQENVARLRKDFSRRASRLGWLTARFDANPQPSLWNLDFKLVGKTMESHMQDAELIIAAINM